VIDLVPAIPLEGQLAVSAFALGVFVAVTLAIWFAGDELKARLNASAAEAIQAFVVTAVGIGAAAVLVVVWRATAEVQRALEAVQVRPRVGVLVLVSLLVFGVAYTVTRVTKRLVGAGVERNTVSAHQREVAHHVIQIVVFAPAILFTLALWGFRPGDLLLGAGAAGIILGLAARQTLGAMLAGFVLLFARPFEVGDWVLVDDEEGTVTDITVFNTRMRTFDGEQVIIPNDGVTGSNIVNRSRNGQLRVTVDVGVDYDTDVEHAAAVAEEAMRDLGADVLRSNPAPDVVLDRFGDSAVVLTLRFWIDDPTIRRKWRAQNAVLEAVKTAFEREGIKIPFPQRELAARPEAGGLQVSGPARGEVTDAAGDRNGEDAADRSPDGDEDRSTDDDDAADDEHDDRQPAPAEED